MSRLECTSGLLRCPLAALAAALSLFVPLVAHSQQHMVLGGRYSTLHPEQKELINRWTLEVEKIVGTRPEPERSYDELPLSSRTTFEAVTHALLRSTLTSSSGEPLGRAIDLVDVVERIAGGIDGTRGDHQYRLYVYLKSDALNKLYASREFRREHDNTVYHLGYPLNFRQLGGAPSVQFSVTRTWHRADIDVDYRSSSALKALFDGHLTAGNSDVRAGGNYQHHNARWQDLTNWWQALLASLFENDLRRADANPHDGPIVPPVSGVWEKSAKAEIHDAVHTYMTEWLVTGDPVLVLRAVSVKAYPCIAEERDGSRPDSKLALYRIHAQMQRANQQVGKVADLADAIEPVDYPLPDAQKIAHPYSNVFSLQLVPDDVAWAFDCRLRYRLELAEAIPRPSHALSGIYVAAWRYKKRPDPNQFRLQFWQKQAGEWKLVSFDEKHSLQPPAPDLVARMAKGMTTTDNRSVRPTIGAGSIEEMESASVRLLTVWLLDKNAQSAIELFAPEAYACEAFEEDQGVAPDARSGEKGRERLLKSLAAVANHMGGGDRLEAVIATPPASHAQMEPIHHTRAGAFLLAGVSDDLLKMHSCSGAPALKSDRAEGAGGGAQTIEAFMTAFQSARAGGDNPATMLLFWQRSAGKWRVVSYAVLTD